MFGKRNDVMAREDAIVSVCLSPVCQTLALYSSQTVKGR